jgi:antitoxin (DNA-binding transcriptional repressor) of toxin-antitoxin stability system
MVHAVCQATRDSSFIITKHGRPVAKRVPEDSKRDDFYGWAKDKVTILGDVHSQDSLIAFGDRQCRSPNTPTPLVVPT